METKIVTIDFAQANAEDYEQLKTAVSDIDVGVLSEYRLNIVYV